jgi:hypothetical protein
MLKRRLRQCYSVGLAIRHPDFGDQQIKPRLLHLIPGGQ